MILVDTNVFMYAAGSSHPNKVPALHSLHRIAAKEIEACVNTVVLQEILHRYRAIGRWDDGKKVCTLACTIVPRIMPIDEKCMAVCYEIMDTKPAIMARDALHIAFCRVNKLDSVLSFDRDLDGFDDVRRLEPQLH